MKLNLYAIHDQAVKEYIGPEPAKTHGEAERRFKANVNNPQNGNLYTSPEHFSLHHIGTYDSETGVITPLKEPAHVISALQLKEKT